MVCCRVLFALSVWLVVAVSADADLRDRVRGVGSVTASPPPPPSPPAHAPHVPVNSDEVSANAAAAQIRDNDFNSGWQPYWVVLVGMVFVTFFIGRRARYAYQIWARSGTAGLLAIMTPSASGRSTSVGGAGGGASTGSSTEVSGVLGWFGFGVGGEERTRRRKKTDSDAIAMSPLVGSGSGNSEPPTPSGGGGGGGNDSNVSVVVESADRSSSKTPPPAIELQPLNSLNAIDSKHSAAAPLLPPPPSGDESPASAAASAASGGGSTGSSGGGSGGGGGRALPIRHGLSESYVSPLLTDSLIVSLLPHLPTTLAIKERWTLLYALREDGASIQTFYHKVSGMGPTLFIIRDQNNHVRSTVQLPTRVTPTLTGGAGRS